ncbi:hypothetical protein [Pseudomonas sp. NPDC086278]
MSLTDTADRNAKLYGKNYTLKDLMGCTCSLVPRAEKAGITVSIG